VVRSSGGYTTESMHNLLKETDVIPEELTLGSAIIDDV
jgi:hypothetical protein